MVNKFKQGRLFLFILIFKKYFDFFSKRKNKYYIYKSAKIYRGFVADKIYIHYYYTLGHSFFYRKTYALFIILVHLGSINYSSSCSTTVQSWNFCKIEIGCLIWLSKSSTRAIFFGDNYQLNHFLFWTKTFYPCVSHIPMLDVPHWMRATITRWYELLFEI